MSSFNYQLVVAHSYPEYGLKVQLDLLDKYYPNIHHIKYYY